MERIDTHSHLFSPELGERINDSTSFEVSLSQSNMRTALGIDLPLISDHTQARDIEKLGLTRRVLSVRTSALIKKEALAGPVEERAQLSKAINDHLIELTHQYPEAFSAYADIPLTPRDVRPAIKELERVNGMNGLVGALIQTNYEGTYLDDERFAPFFARAHELNVPLFLHPTLPFGLDPLLDYHLYMIVGFPYDTTLTIARLVYSGFFVRYPNLAMITSHAGGTIPFLWWRLGLGYRENREGCRDHLDRDPEYYLRRLFYDTALSDTKQLMQTYDRVGDRIVLGTDYPFEAEGTARTLKAIESMDVDEQAKNAIFSGTLKTVLGLSNEA